MDELIDERVVRMVDLACRPAKRCALCSIAMRSATCARWSCRVIETVVARASRTDPTIGG
jgi:hypothetical protein